MTMIHHLQEDPEAHNKFLRINRAYEVLKDDSLRKVSRYSQLNRPQLYISNYNYGMCKSIMLIHLFIFYY